MKLSETILDERSGQTAVAVGASANRGVLNLPGLGLGKAIRVPSVSSIADPAPLTASCCDPNSGASSAVVNEQSPLAVEVLDVSVANGDAGERIDNNQVFVSKNQLGLDPEQSCCGSQSNCCGNVDQEVAAPRVEQSLNQEHAVEQQCCSSPNQIVSGAENQVLLHATIIAGASAVDEKRK